MSSLFGGKERVRCLLAVVDHAALVELLGAAAWQLRWRACGRGCCATLRRHQGGRGDRDISVATMQPPRCMTDAHSWSPSAREEASTKPNSASASVNAMPRNIVVRTVPADSGWRASR